MRLFGRAHRDQFSVIRREKKEKLFRNSELSHLCQKIEKYSTKVWDA